MKTAKLGLWIGCLLSFTMLTSCAAMMESWREQTCNYDGSYQEGMNDARTGKQMNDHFVAQCPDPSQADAQRGYREGYTAGAAGHPVVGLVPGEPRQCLEAFGRKECGYHCIQAFGEIACAQRPDHNCVEAFGKVRCGRNCREEYGKIACD